MALVVKDRVKETTATTGTGTLTLAGAVAGFQTFTSVLSNGDTTYYGIFESSTGEFEVGLGTFTSSGTTLARTTILESSNSGSAINLTAGAADVFITQPAEKAVYLDGSGYIATADGRNLTNVDAATVDSLDSTQFLRSDANDTATGVVTFDNDSGINVVYSTSDTTNITGYGIISNRAAFYLRPTTDNSYTLYVGGSDASYDWSSIELKVGNNNNVNINGNTVWHAGNDGSGSGLDADLLDGVQGSSYLRSDADDSASGDITFTESIQVQSGAGSANPIRIGSGFGSGGSSTIHKYGAALYLQYNNGQTSTDVIMGGGGTTANLRMQSGYIDNISSAYVQDYIYHQNDVDTYLGFGTDTITLATGGSAEVTVTPTGVQLGDTGNGYFQPVSGGVGSIQIDGGAHGGWEGYSIGGRAVFMHDNGTATTIYDDVNNKYLWYATHNGASYIYYDGAYKLNTISSGVNIEGDLNAVDNIYMGYRLYHEGDTDTYVQFDNNVIYLIAGGSSSFIAASSYSSTYVPMYNYAAYFEETSQLSGTTPTINAAASGVFYLTMSGNTTFTFTGTSSNWGIGFVLYLTGNGSTVTWPTSVDWAGGTAPDAPANGEVDVLVFHTRDGSNWVGALAVDAAS